MVSDETWQSLFSAKSVAVIGASNSIHSWGGGITRHLLESGKRPVYAVNPGYSEIQGLHSYKSATEIQEPVDLGVIVVRAELVLMALQDLVTKGVKAAVIISGGFNETDEAGSKREAEIINIARSGGIRFIGPNTMGHLDNASKLNTVSFSEQKYSGKISLIAQSGNMGTRIMHDMARYGIGMSKFVCCGNEADIKLEDYLEYFARDPNTSVIMLYIEGLRDAKRFMRIARQITLTKPIIAMKSGGTETSAKASRSHTGALTGSDEIYTAAFRQTGVIRVDDDLELCDVTVALLNQPLPRGRRVGILTMGGGLGVVTAEACEKEGLEIAALEPSTIAEFDALLPSRWSHGNPVDLVGSDVGRVTSLLSITLTLLKDRNLDAVISNSWLGHFRRARRFNKDDADDYNHGVKEEEARSIRKQFSKYDKPLLMVSSQPQRPDDLRNYTLYHREGFSIFPQPFRAARTLRHLNWYREYLESSK